MNFLKFLISRTFWLQVLIAIVLIVGGLFLVQALLKSYTRSGRTVLVPEFVGKTQDEVVGLLEHSDLHIELVDSVYKTGERPGVIVDQTPSSETKVKKGRTIYVTINAFGKEMARMPDLITNCSASFARVLLEQAGLMVGDISYKPNPNSQLVLEQSVGGKKIEPGTQIPKGTKVDLVVGMGNEGDLAIVPNVIGMGLRDAIAAMGVARFNIGILNYDETVVTGPDSLAAVVFKQVPSARDGSQIAQAWSPINVWLTTDVQKVTKNAVE